MTRGFPGTSNDLSHAPTSNPGIIQTTWRNILHLSPRQKRLFPYFAFFIVLFGLFLLLLVLFSTHKPDTFCTYYANYCLPYRRSLPSHWALIPWLVRSWRRYVARDRPDELSRLTHVERSIRFSSFLSHFEHAEWLQADPTISPLFRHDAYEHDGSSPLFESDATDGIGPPFSSSVFELPAPFSSLLFLIHSPVSSLNASFYVFLCYLFVFIVLWHFSSIMLIILRKFPAFCLNEFMKCMGFIRLVRGLHFIANWQDSLCCSCNQLSLKGLWMSPFRFMRAILLSLWRPISSFSCGWRLVSFVAVLSLSSVCDSYISVSHVAFPSTPPILTSQTASDSSHSYPAANSSAEPPLSNIFIACGIKSATDTTLYPPPVFEKPLQALSPVELLLSEFPIQATPVLLELCNGTPLSPVLTSAKLKTPMFLDSGADLSLISESLWRQLGSPSLTPTTRSARSQDAAHPIQLLGTCTLRIELTNGASFYHSFFVQAEATLPCILSFPARYHLGSLLLIDAWNLPPDYIPPYLRGRVDFVAPQHDDAFSSDKVHFVSALKTVNIPPHEWRIVNIDVPTFQADFFGSHAYSDVFIANACLNAPDSNGVPQKEYGRICVLNSATDATRTIKAGATIGFCRDISSNPAIQSIPYDSVFSQDEDVPIGYRADLKENQLLAASMMAKSSIDTIDSSSRSVTTPSSSEERGSVTCPAHTVTSSTATSSLSHVPSLSVLGTSTPPSSMSSNSSSDDYENWAEPALALAARMPNMSAKLPTDKELKDQLSPMLHHLPLLQRAQFEPMLLSHKKIMHEVPGPALIPSQRIIRSSDSPVHCAPRRQSPPMQMESDKLTEAMEKSGITRPSNSPICSPVVLVKKKDGTFRFCIDYRRLNETLILDRYPLPIIRDITDSLAGATIFTTFDLKSGYHQIPLDERDKHLTSFVTPSGQWEFNVLPFGLATAPSIFQRVLDLVLKGLKKDFVLVYIDDLVVFSKTFGEHLRHVDTTLSRLEKFNLRLSLKKCTFAQPSTQFLGHRVSADGVQPDDIHVERIRNWPTPRTAEEAGRFIHMAGYYRDYVLHFAEVVEPIHKLTLTGVPFIWTTECDQAFCYLRRILSSAPLLVYPRFDRTFILSTDCSTIAMGAVLEQLDDQARRHPVAYFSKKLNLAQSHYSATERECLALVEAIKHWSHYLLHDHFLVFTDHSALSFLNKKIAMSDGHGTPLSKLTHWQMLLQEFQFTVFHRPGLINSAPDALSRQEWDNEFPLVTPEVHGSPPPPPIVSSSLSDPPAFFVAAISLAPEFEADSNQSTPSSLSFVETVKAAQVSSSELFPLIHWLRDRVLPSDPQIARSVQWRTRDLAIYNGILVHVAPRDSAHAGERQFARIVVPKSLRATVVDYFHSEKFTGGHRGFSKVFSAVSRRFWWPGYWKDIQQHVAACEICQRMNTPHRLPAGSIVPQQVPGLFERIALDFVGPLPISIHHNRYALVITDYFSRWVEVYPLMDQSKESVAVCLADWCTRYGAPLSIRSDRGKSFLNEMITAYCKLWSINQSPTSPYHPESDGLVERMNGTLCDMLRAFASETGRLWDENCNAILFAYRITMHTGANNSPDMLVFGQHLRTPLDVDLEKYIQQKQFSPLSPDFLFRHAQALWQARELARRYMETYQMKYAARYNETHRLLNFDIGDIVWLEVSHRAHKFAPKWIGPYKVHGKASDNMYFIHDVAGVPHPSPVHIQHLKRAVFIPTDIVIPERPLNPSVSTSSSAALAPINCSSSSSSSSNAESTRSLIPVAPTVVMSRSAVSTSIEPAPFTIPPSSSFAREPSTNAEIEALEDESGVERILDKRTHNRHIEYLVKWCNRPLDKSSWVPKSELQCDNLINSYEQSQVPLPARKAAKAAVRSVEFPQVGHFISPFAPIADEVIASSSATTSIASSASSTSSSSSSSSGISLHTLIPIKPSPSSSSSSSSSSVTSLVNLSVASSSSSVARSATSSPPNSSASVKSSFASTSSSTHDLRERSIRHEEVVPTHSHALRNRVDLPLATSSSLPAAEARRLESWSSEREARTRS